MVSELISRPPIVGNFTLGAYCVGVLLPNSVLLFFFFVSMLRIRMISQAVAKAYRHNNRPVTLIASHFRQLIAPFARITVLATLIYAGLVLARGPWFAAWEWSPGIIALYIVILVYVWIQLFCIHLDWHHRLREEKARERTLLTDAVAAGGDADPLEKLEGLSDWAWDLRGFSTVVLSIILPLLAFVLQTGSYAGLFRRVAKL